MNENNLLNTVVGPPCQKAWDGLWPSIFFEFGNKVTQKKYEHDSDWEYSLGMDVCPWLVIQDEKVVLSSDDVPEKAAAVFEIFKNKVLNEIEINTEEKFVVFTFSEGLILETSHVNEDDEFYLLTPTQILTMGKNCKITITDRV